MSIRKIVDKTVDITMALSMVIVFLVTFAQVISRFVFQLSIPWSTDIIRLTFLYSLFLGVTVGLREKGHLNIDVVFNLLNKKAQIVLSILINILIGGFLVFLLVKGLSVVSGAMGQRMPYLDMPISVLYFAIPLNAAFMLYYLIPQILEYFSDLKNAGKS